MTTARGVLELVRPPNVFTAFADSLAGMLVAGARAPALVAASGCLYLGGLVLNDLFDREVDARERPRRPIPSGQVSPGFAAALAAGLLIAGGALAASVSRGSLAVAGALAVAIIAYDGFLKNTLAGPLGMGLCRAGNFLLGLSAAGLAELPLAAGYGPALLGLYIVTLTFIARDEVGGNTRLRARAGLVVMTLSFAAAAAWLATRAAPWPAWAWLGAFVALAATNWAPLWTDPSGARTRRAIGGGILLIPVLDASVVALVSPLAAAGVAALAIPAMILRRWFSPT